MNLAWHQHKVASHTMILACLVHLAGPVQAGQPESPKRLPAAQAVQIQTLTEVLKARPFAIDALRKRADLNADRGQYQLAVQDLTLAIDHEPLARQRYSGIFVRRAQFYERLAKYDQAARDVEIFLSASRQTAKWAQPFWFSECARMLLEGEAYAESVKCADQFISLSPGHATAYASRAMSMAFLGRLDQATSDLSEMLRLKLTPRDLEKGVLTTQPVINLCLERFTRQARSSPKETKKLLGRAVAEVIARRFDQAQASCTTALKLSPSNYEALLIRALANLSLNKKNDSLKDIDEAIRLHADEPTAYRILEQCYLDSSGSDDLLADLSKRCQAQPQNRAVRMALAHCYRLSRNSERELQSYQELLAKDPSFVPALVGCADSSRESGDLPKAISYYNRILLLHPDNLPALKGRAACFVELSDFTRALTDLNKALKISDDAVVILARERCLRKLR